MHRLLLFFCTEKLKQSQMLFSERFAALKTKKPKVTGNNKMSLRQDGFGDELSSRKRVAYSTGNKCYH